MNTNCIQIKTSKLHTTKITKITVQMSDKDMVK